MSVENRYYLRGTRVGVPCPRAIAQFERWLISERTKDGIATARKHGRNPGRPPLQPETISALQDLVEAGKSVSQAAKHLTPEPFAKPSEVDDFIPLNG